VYFKVRGDNLISRRTTLLLVDIYYNLFTKHYTKDKTGYRNYHRIKKDELVEFLFKKEYDEKFIALIKKLNISNPKKLKEFIRGLQTGESLEGLVEDKNESGQFYLKNLIEDILDSIDSIESDKVINRIIVNVK